MRKKNGFCSKRTDKVTSLFKNFLATDSRALFGHSLKKFIAVQFIIAGNFLERCRNVEPTGEKHKTSWKKVKVYKFCFIIKLILSD